MRTISILIGILPAFINCTPVKNQLNPSRQLDGSRVMVTGLPVVPTASTEGAVPVRREIHDLRDNYPDQWNLYLLGLRAFQLSDQTSPVSYYEIAGIHGKPFKVWEHAEGLPGENGPYCPHNNIMFYGWHRPYLALFEQELYKHVQAIAQQYPPDLIDRYIVAASLFRIPYWDWALGEKGGSIPEIFLWPSIQVIGTDGAGQMIPNPLYQYEFHPLIPDDFTDNWANWNTTLRWPTTKQPDAVSRLNTVISEFDGRRRTILNKISSAYTIPQSFNTFSLNYIEDVHGWIHYILGGTEPAWGHMWPTEYSGFDPVFMLHHCMVDRLFDIWLAAHPDKNIEPAKIGGGNMWLAAGQTVDGDTQLSPFWNSANTFWTTNEIRDTRVLGYAYPETARWNFATDEEFRASVNASIAQLYSSSARAALTAGPNTAGTSLNHLLTDGTFVDWNIQIDGSHHDLPASFIMEFFLIGDFSSDAVVEVGAWTVLSTDTHHGKAAKMKRMSSSESHLKGMVSLTASLLDDIAEGKLRSLNARDVVPYLKDKLTWKVKTGEGSLMHQSELGAVTVQVMSTIVRIPDDPNQLLEYSGEWETHPDVTSGKSGGVKA